MSHEAMNIEQSQAEKAQTLQALTSGPLASSVSKLASSSRGIPSGKDFHFYSNFDEFRVPAREIERKSQSMLGKIGSSAHIWGKEMALPEDMEEAYDWLVNINDEVFERLDTSLDEFKKIRKEEEESSRAVCLPEDTEDGFQLVIGKKKKKALSQMVKDSESGKEEGQESSGQVSGVKVATKDKRSNGVKPKVPFHIPTIRRPQDEFNILVNNSNQPFEHVWLKRSEDGLRFIHPLEELSVMDFVDKDTADLQPAVPPSIECTQFKLVEEVKDLKELANKLHGVKEFAVDLEHNQYRSFQGLTCLMQISTRTEDFIVDTLKLRVYIGPYLREVFKDPTKKKVMHGADRDIIWLQRDFGIYVCNLFDTGQASRVLMRERNSLEYLLHHYCGVTANKEYQNADWRLRPLPEEMIRYAREDTHFLLYMYDLMRIELSSMPKESEDSDAPLVEVYKRSYGICMHLYEKELMTEESYLFIYGLQGAGFNAQQLAVVAGLCEWRDIVARAEDESTGYILPNKTLLEIAKQMPVSAGKLRHVLRSKHPYVERNLGSVVSIIRHSMLNANAFEDVVEQLKEARTEMDAPTENLVLNDSSETILSDAPTNLEYVNDVTKSSDTGNTLNGRTCGPSPISLKFKEESSSPLCSVSKLANVVQGNRFQHAIENENRQMSSKRELSLGSQPTSGQRRDPPSDSSLLHAAKVAGANVPAQKKPGSGLGFLLGNPSTTKRKVDTDKKDKEVTKLEQIRSSVNLPFHSFSGSPGPLKKPVSELPITASEPHRPELPVAESLNSSNLPGSSLDDIIMIEDDSGEKLIEGDSKTTDEPKENGSSPVVEIDSDEPISLSNLSSSFHECLQASNKSRKARELDKWEKSDRIFQLNPFDYEAARKEVVIGESTGRSNSRGKKKVPSLAVDLDGDPKDGGTRELQQGKRRQAFPASGNRSTTFR